MKRHAFGIGFPREDINPLRNKAISPKEIYDFFMCQRANRGATFGAYYFRNYLSFCQWIAIVRLIEFN